MAYRHVMCKNNFIVADNISIEALPCPGGKIKVHSLVEYRVLLVYIEETKRTLVVRFH